MYRRAHCWSNVAKSAHVRLMSRLRNQSELTHTAEAGGENGVDGLGSVGGIMTWEPFEEEMI